MTSMIALGAEAMRAKRRELIAQPLDRIWPDLMRAAIEAMREPTEAMLEAACPLPQHLIEERNDPDYTLGMTNATLIGQAVVRQRYIDCIDAALKEQP